MIDPTLASVSLICRYLTDHELAILNNFVQVGWEDTLQRIQPEIYEKVRPLFTEQDETRFHQASREALSTVVYSRLQAWIPTNADEIIAEMKKVQEEKL